jgi:DNA helicase-2/ATP-dependent DNA helicase PcrA
VSLVEGARLAVETGALGGKGAKELEAASGRLARCAVDDGVARWRRPRTHRRWARAISSHIELAEVILDESGYTAHWQNDKTPEAPGRLENLKELVKALESSRTCKASSNMSRSSWTTSRRTGSPRSR